MNNLIDRQAAIDALDGNVKVTGIKTAQAVMEYIIECAGRIRSLPSAQPEPSQVARDIATIIENEQDMRVILAKPEQKKGKWIVSKSDTGKLKTKCSVCGATYSNYLRLIMNFCPNCGCQMKGDEL